VNVGALPPNLATQAARPQVSAKPTYRVVTDSPADAKIFLTAREKAQVKLADQDVPPVLGEYLSRRPQGEFADEAHLILARRAFADRDPETAIRHANEILNMNPPSKLRGQAILIKAKSEVETGSRRSALSTLARIDLTEIPKETRGELFELWGKTAELEGKNLEAVLALVKATKEASSAEQKSQLEKNIQTLISGRLSESELEFVLKEYPADWPSAEVLLRLAAIRATSGNKPEAQKLYQTVIAQNPPNSIAARRAQEGIARLNSLTNAFSNRIGVLVPLSGEQESIGKIVVEGLRAAVKDLKGGSAIEFVVTDVGPNPDSARQAFERLVFEDKVMAVVGPLSGSQAETVARASAEWGVPNISLSARPGLTDLSPFLFQYALTPDRQVRALVAYVKEKLNAKRFAILFPRDSFGKEFATAYFDAVKEWDGVVTAAESYDPQQVDFKNQIENIVGKSFPQWRKKELESQVQSLKEKLGRDPTKKEIGKIELPPIVDFDVLMIPDTFKAVGQIVPALMYADILTPKILGPSTWNNARLLARAGQYLDGALFVDVFSPERASRSTKEFVEKISEIKGSAPTAFMATAYDVGLALKSVYSQTLPASRDDLKDALLNLGNIEGVCGVQIWNERRQPLSEVQLFQVRKGSFAHQGGIVIRPAKEF
jgi:branched-chain amino acid transport system substrate-binding protein